MLYIVVPDAVFEPRAMIISSNYTLITFLAMLRIGYLQRLTIITRSQKDLLKYLELLPTKSNLVARWLGYTIYLTKNILIKDCLVLDYII